MSKYLTKKLLYGISVRFYAVVQRKSSTVKVSVFRCWFGMNV